MKKLPLILSIISLLAVVALFVLNFTVNDDKDSLGSSTENQNFASGGISYVNVDSIIFNFEMYFDLRDVLMVKQKDSETQLNAMGRQYETGARDYEDKVRKGLVTRATAAEMEQGLLQQQQELVNLRDQLQMELMEEEQVMNRRVLEYIYQYLEEYTEEKGFDYILGKSFGGPVMYSKPGLDITSDVLTGINNKYLAEKK
ncbi:MAG TPA: OmpH family outer membrane protein [Bacteroidales bacterium]|nr:OmpH family outer membrane protein [Bacteroidales bacterium]